MIPRPAGGRGLAASLALCALATLTLLASHPSVQGGLPDILRSEARQQLINGVVHGGFIVTLCALLVCFVFLSRRLGSERVAVVLGFVSFCVGCGALMAALIIDGFVIPAIATRFVGLESSSDLDTARTLLFLCGTTIRFLMPMGLVLQAAAIVSWSVVIIGKQGWRLVVGVGGTAVGVVLMAGVFAAPARLGQHVLLGGIVLESLWYLALAGLLAAGKDGLDHSQS